MVDRYRTWEPRDLALPRQTVTDLRSELLERAVRTFSPDLLIADFMPAGPYGELLPALEQLERSGGRAVAGFRDIIDEPSFVRDLWEETGVYETLREHYAAICVYGDPRVMDFADDYGLHDAADRLRYCGYLGRAQPAAPDPPVLERPFVIASCGGGADGATLLDAFIRSAAGIRSRIGGTWLAVSGPLMPPATHARLSRLAALHDVQLRRAVPGLRSYTAVADCVVAMPGYNTVCDVLSYRRNAVFVPRLGPSHEQRLRADRLRNWDLAQIVVEPSAELLRVSIERALASSPVTAPLPLDGLERAVDVFDRSLELAPAAAA
jgi:predicted glycosyltransferase